MADADTIATTWGAVAVVQARLDELATVIAILDEVAAWLVARGIDQWRPGTFDPAPIARRLAAGEVYLAWHGQEPVATVTLQWSDPIIWGDMPDDAGYVHRLAVRRAWAGRGLGQHLLTWAEQQVASAGRRYLRLDCMTDNAGLCAYYARLGFVERGVTHGPGWSARRYERAVDDARPGWAVSSSPAWPTSR